MGDHRATPRRLDRRAVIMVLLALTAVFLVVVVVLKVVVDRNEADDASGTVPPPAAASTTGPTSPQTTADPSPSSPTSPGATASGAPEASPSPTRSASADLAELEPAAASRIVIDDVVDAGFDASISPNGGRLSPLSRDEVARWGDRGLPGNPATDTVVLVGSTRDATASLWGLEGVAPGATITLTTANGLVSYTVEASRTISSTTGATDPLLRENIPGRLILVGARYDAAGERAASDLVLVASLSGVDRS